MKNKWWKDKAYEIQAYADYGYYRDFFFAMKVRHGPVPYIKNATIWTWQHYKQRRRWKSYFKNLWNNNTHVNTSVPDGIPIPEQLTEPDGDILPEKINAATNQIKNGKVDGLDKILLNILKLESKNTINALHKLFSTT